jgi:hypothetical protein
MIGKPMLYLYLTVLIASLCACPSPTHNVAHVIIPQPVQRAADKHDHSPNTLNPLTPENAVRRQEGTSSTDSGIQNMEKNKPLELPGDLTISKPSSLPKTSAIFEKAIDQYETFHLEEAFELFLSVAENAHLDQDLRAQSYFFCGVCKYILGEEFLSYFEQAKSLATEFKPDPLEFKPELIALYEQCRKKE